MLPLACWVSSSQPSFLQKQRGLFHGSVPAPWRQPDPGFLPSLSELPGSQRNSTTVFLACLQRQSSTFLAVREHELCSQGISWQPSGQQHGSGLLV